jgi:DNA-3-methyladenine glycosylase
MSTGSQPLCPEELRPISAEFFARDPRDVAPGLLGALVLTISGGVRTGGRIVETEAYLGVGDPGSHAATKSMTKRNAVMYGPPGSVYVYFSYGNHFMLNLVCCPEGEAGAVLIRAIQPLVGVEVMRERRGGRTFSELANGPGKVCAALGVDLSDNATMLGVGKLVVYHYREPRPEDVAVSGRIGLGAGHDLDLRYYLRGNEFVSRGRAGVSTRRT